MKACSILVTCEHAANAVPPDLSTVFSNAENLLAGHRGWDPGALDLARAWSERWNSPLVAATVSRLVCDANRSLHHPALWSEFTRSLPRTQKNDILARYYQPYRDAVNAEIARLTSQGETVLHLASHSFTPVLHGKIRPLDIGLLYDPARPGERTLAELWSETLRKAAPDLRIRRNAPYRGVADGLPTSLRRRHASNVYLGFEIECNQALLEHGPFPAVLLAETLEQALKHITQS